MIIFQMIGDHRGSQMSTAVVCKRCKVVLKTYIIRFLIEPQIRIYQYTPIKIQFK